MANDPDETDPMLGGPKEQGAYIAKLVETMQSQAESDKASRRAQAAASDATPVLAGSEGFGDSSRVV